LVAKSQTISPIIHARSSDEHCEDAVSSVGLKASVDPRQETRIILEKGEKVTSNGGKKETYQ
jgi:hypothetical protein